MEPFALDEVSSLQPRGRPKKQEAGASLYVSPFLSPENLRDLTL